MNDYQGPKSAVQALTDRLAQNGGDYEFAYVQLKKEEPVLASRLIVTPSSDSGMVTVRGGPKSIAGVSPVDLDAIHQAAYAGAQSFYTDREILERKRQIAELEEAEKIELRQELTSLRDGQLRTDAALVSHFVDHQLVQDGQRQVLNLGQSLQFLLAGRDEKTRAQLVAGLKPDELEALQAAERGDVPALPAPEILDEKTIEVPQKKRGLFGRGA